MKYDELKVRRKVNIHLKECGIIPGNLGYEYIRTAIELAIEDSSILHSITKILYPEIAKIHNTTNTKVERAIRHTIDTAFTMPIHEAKLVLYKYFGNSISAKSGRAPNGVFLSALVEEIRLELQEEHKSQDYEKTREESIFR